MVTFGDWAITEQVASRLDERLSSLNPRLIVECGSGSSTFVMGSWADKNNARVIALEHQVPYRDKTRELCKDLASVEVAYAPIDKRNNFYSFDIPNHIDFVLIDGPPSTIGRQATLPALWPYLSGGAEVWLDDANRDHEKKCVEKWKRDYDIVVEIDTSEKGLAIIRREQ